MDSEGWDPDASERDWAAAFKDAYKEDPPADIEPLGAVLFFLCVRFFGSPFTQKSAKNASFFYKRVKVIFIVSSCDSTVCNSECALKFPVQRCPVFL